MKRQLVILLRCVLLFAVLCVLAELVVQLFAALGVQYRNPANVALTGAFVATLCVILLMKHRKNRQ